MSDEPLAGEVLGEPAGDAAGPAEQPSLATRFEAFLAEHPRRSLEVEGVRWSYRPLGSGSEGLILLPGAVGGGEVYFLLAEELRERFRMLMIDYPPVRGLAEMLDGLAAILEREGIERTALLGGSFGGLVAQAFLRRFPERTSRVVLSATAPPDPERAAANERWLRRLRWLPMPVFRGLMRLVVRKLTAGIEERAFWRGVYGRAVAAWTRDGLESQYRVSIDFDREDGERTGLLDDWPGEILILAGSEDTVASAASLEALRSAYPRSRVQVLEGAGHGLSLERPEEWKAAICGFLGTAATSAPPAGTPARPPELR